MAHRIKPSTRKKNAANFKSNAAKLAKIRDQARRKKSLEETGLPGQVTNANRIKALAKLNKTKTKAKARRR